MGSRRKPGEGQGVLAIGYIRVSTQEQATEGVSLEAQRARIDAYCTMRGLTLQGIEQDPGVSAGKYTLAEREGGPGTPTLISREALAAAGLSLTEGLAERAARSIAEVEEKGERPIERFTEQLRDILAALVRELLGAELAALGDRLERSMERLMLEHPTRRSERASEKTALLVRLQALRREGLSMQAMASHLNEQGVPTSSGRGLWRKGTIFNLLAEGGERGPR